MLSESARGTLLRIARDAVEAAVRGEHPPRDAVDDPELQGCQGAFVTLRTHERLRGCIGRFIAEEPLWRVVRAMAAAAAREDPRFFGNPLTPAELPAVEIEVSVLSPLRRIQDPATQFELGKHGVYIKRGFSAGCFLPQVALETGWSKEEFLSQCCAGKAGLPPNAWRDPATEVYVFAAEIVAEA